MWEEASPHYKKLASDSKAWGRKGRVTRRNLKKYNFKVFIVLNTQCYVLYAFDTSVPILDYVLV